VYDGGRSAPQLETIGEPNSFLGRPKKQQQQLSSRSETALARRRVHHGGIGRADGGRRDGQRGGFRSQKTAGCNSWTTLGLSKRSETRG